MWDRLYEIRSVRMPHEYQDYEKASIEKEFNNRRVRQVHYRNQAVKILREYDNGIVKELAYCADKDFPLILVKIPK